MQRRVRHRRRGNAVDAPARWNHAGRRDRRLRNRVLGRARGRAGQPATCCAGDRVSTVLLICVPLVDLVLLVVSAIDLRRGAPANFTHGLAAAYLGFSVAFGHSMVRWADQRFAHRFAGGPPPWRPPKQGAARVRYEWREWARMLLAWAVASVLLVTAMCGRRRSGPYGGAGRLDRAAGTGRRDLVRGRSAVDDRLPRAPVLSMQGHPIGAWRPTRCPCRPGGYQGVARTASTTMAVTAPTPTSSSGLGGGSPPWTSGRHRRHRQPREERQPGRLGPAAGQAGAHGEGTATPAPTRNGQPGVLRMPAHAADQRRPGGEQQHHDADRRPRRRRSGSARPGPRSRPGPPSRPSIQPNPASCAARHRQQRAQAGGDVEERPAPGEVEAHHRQAEPRRGVREQRGDAERDPAGERPAPARQPVRVLALARTPIATMAAPSTATTTSTETATQTAYGARMSTGTYRRAATSPHTPRTAVSTSGVTRAPRAAISTPEREPVGQAERGAAPTAAAPARAGGRARRPSGPTGVVGVRPQVGQGVVAHPGHVGEVVVRRLQRPGQPGRAVDQRERQRPDEGGRPAGEQDGAEAQPARTGPVGREQHSGRRRPARAALAKPRAKRYEPRNGAERVPELGAGPHGDPGQGQAEPGERRARSAGPAAARRPRRDQRALGGHRRDTVAVSRSPTHQRVSAGIEMMSSA